MLRAALSYPTRKPDGPRSVLLGGGLVFLTMLLWLPALLGGTVGLVAILGVFPWLALRGYYVRVLRTSAGRDRPTPPPLDDADRLLRDGATAVAIAAAYLLPGVLVLGPLVYARAVGADLPTLYTAAGMSEGLANAAVSATGFVAIVAVMSLIGALYATPVAVTRFAREDRVAAAFEGRRVVAGALTEDYAVAWAIALLVQVVLFPIALALRAVLVGFFLQFVVAVGVRYCYARGVGHGLDLDPVAPATEERTRGQDTSGDTRGSPNSDAGEDTADGPDPTTVGTAAEMDDGGAAETDHESAGSGDAPTGTDDASTTDDHEGERT
jgi:hypothetical protein